MTVRSPRESRIDMETEVERMSTMGREIRAHTTAPVSSDLNDLYDEEGFPSGAGDFSQTDIQPALKA